MPLVSSPPDRILLSSGLLLFLIGLVQGTVVHLFASPRLALSAHIAAVQNGIVLVVLALAWSRIRLAPRAAAVSMTAMAGGMYLIWVAFSLAAIAGAASAFPFAGRGPIVSPAADVAVTALVYVGAVASIAGAFLALVGAVRGRPVPTPAPTLAAALSDPARAGTSVGSPPAPRDG